MKNIITLTELDVLVDERVNGITPEQKIIQILDTPMGMLKLSFVQSLCRELIDFGQLNTFEDVSKCFVQSWYEITKEKPVEEMINDAMTTQEKLEGKVLEMQRRLGA